MEVALAITKLQEKAKADLNENIEIDLDIPESFGVLFDAIDQLKDGTKFTKQMSKIKFQTLLDAGDDQISHLAESYKTADKRFETPINSEISPRDDDWNL